MTQDQLSAIRERLDAAIPGLESLVGVELKYALRVTYPQSVACRELIANAPTDLCALLDEVERLTAERDIAFARGAEAMRTAAIAVASKRADLPKHSDLDSAWCRSAECILDELRHLHVPEDK